jgi:hypothetical protein
LVLCGGIGSGKLELHIFMVIVCKWCPFPEAISV